MARSEADRAIEKAKEKVSALLQRTEGRRVSVLPSDASDKIEDAISPARIKSQQQLEHWVKTDPGQVLFHLKELHQERDAALECVESWEQLEEKQKETLQIAIKAQERCLTAKDERDRLREKIAPLQEEVMTHEEKIHELKEALVREQDKNASLEADLARSRRELRESPSPSTIAGKRSAKFPDPAVFTGSDDPTFEGWYFNMMDKLRTNEDHFDSEQAKAAYVIQRTGGEAVKHVNAYRVANAGYFTTPEMVFQVLKEVYEDTDRLRKARQEYLDLKQGPKEEFASFYNKLIRNGRLLEYSDRMLMDDLIPKLNKGLRSALANNPRRFESVVQMKDHLILVDNARRQVQAEADREAAARKAVESPKPSSSSRSQPYSRQITTATRTTQPAAVTPAPTTEAKIEKKDRVDNNCFICHQPGHLARDCPERATKGEAMIKELMIGRGTPSPYHSDSEN